MFGQSESLPAIPEEYIAPRIKDMLEGEKGYLRPEQISINPDGSGSIISTDTFCPEFKEMDVTPVRITMLSNGVVVDVSRLSRWHYAQLTKNEAAFNAAEDRENFPEGQPIDVVGWLRNAKERKRFHRWLNKNLTTKPINRSPAAEELGNPVDIYASVDMNDN